jgi:hypothetical protein
MVFKRITRWMAELENGKNMEQVRAACKKAAADFLVLKQPLVDFLEHARMISLYAQEICNTAHYQYNNSQDAYQTFQDVKYGVGDKKSSSKKASPFVKPKKRKI